MVRYLKTLPNDNRWMREGRLEKNRSNRHTSSLHFIFFPLCFPSYPASSCTAHGAECNVTNKWKQHIGVGCFQHPPITSALILTCTLSVQIWNPFTYISRYKRLKPNRENKLIYVHFISEQHHKRWRQQLFMTIQTTAENRLKGK